MHARACCCVYVYTDLPHATQSELDAASLSSSTTSNVDETIEVRVGCCWV
jgi:hypothetical protein